MDATSPKSKTTPLAWFTAYPGRAMAVWVLGGLLLLTLAFGPALRGPFFFDDEHFIVRNTSIQSLANIPEIYRTTVTQSAHIAGNFYRPNQQIVYSLLYQIWGTTVSWPYHLVPILFHSANAWLLGVWLVTLGYRKKTAWIAAFFFAIHPVQTEAVAYISGLADPLALFFMMLGLVGYTKGLSRLTQNPIDRPLIQSVFLTIWPSIWCLFALTSKENAVVFLPLMILTSAHWVLREHRRLPTKAIAGLASVAIQTLTYLGLKFTVLNFTKTIGLTDDINAYTQDLGLRLTTFLHIIWDYVVLIVAPLDLYYEKPYTAYPGFSHPRAWFGIALLLLSTVLILRAKKNPRLALGVAFFWAALVPFMGVIPVNAMYLEHWLYVPMVGLTLILAEALSRMESPLARISKAKVVVYGTGLLLLAAMVYRTHQRSKDWADPERFYLGEIAHGSVAARTYNNLGLYYADHGESDKAAKYWQLAADSATSRPYPQPHHNLARYYLERGNLQGGLKELHLALKADPKFVYSLAVLHEIFSKLGDLDKSRASQAALEKVLRGETYDFATLESLLFSAGSQVH